MKAFFHQLAVAILGGVVVLLVSLFLQRPATTHVAITHDGMVLPSATVSGALNAFLAAKKVPNDVIADAVSDLPDYVGLMVHRYTVTNNEARILNDITVNLPSYVAAAVSDDDGVRTLHERSYSESALLPDKSFTLLVLVSEDAFSFAPYQKPLFTLNKASLPISELRPIAGDETDILGLFALAHPFLAFILIAIGALTLVLLVIGLIVEIATKGNIEYKAKNTSEGTLTTYIKIINQIRKVDPTKLQKAENALALSAGAPPQGGGP